MNNQEKIIMLEKYIKAGSSPILLENFNTENLKNAVILNSDCDNSLLNGHYEDINFVAPEWYNQILEKSKNTYSLLVIKDLNKIDKEEQLKFLELFKYKKVSTFELPKNCVIVVTCTNLEENSISEEIYSLLAHIC